MATAGLRLLDVDLQEKILEECRKVLGVSGFKFQDDWASVITGNTMQFALSEFCETMWEDFDVRQLFFCLGPFWLKSYIRGRTNKNDNEKFLGYSRCWGSVLCLVAILVYNLLRIQSLKRSVLVADTGNLTVLMFVFQFLIPDPDF